MLAVVAALAFPAFPSETLAIVAPADGATIVVSDEGDSANVTLKYVLAAPGATRLCLDLRRAALQYYRGPLLRRRQDAAAHAPYAKGCYAVGQPVTLEKLSLGSFVLHATAEGAASGAVLGRATSFFAVTYVNAAAFVPTYAWQPVADGQSIPSGLEVKLQLHGGAENATDEPPPQRLARIPPTWRLQVYVGSFEGVSYGFAREDVTAASTIRDVEAAMRRGLPSHSHRTRAASDAPCAPRLELWLGGARLSPDETAEEARLFTRRGALTAKVLPCVPAAGGAGAALARAEDHKVAEDDARRASAPGAGSTASSSPRVSGREGTLSEAPVLALAAPP